jgi:antitoxin component YwqK of YwqJK toxin-antitoxin module
MKTLLLSAFALSCLVCVSQPQEQLYDHNWKPTNDVQKARFYSMTEHKDSLWVTYDYYIFEKKLQMKGSYKDSAKKIRHGEFTWYHANGYLERQGTYINNKQTGTWVSYYENGVMRDSSHYIFGNKKGISLSWHYNGFMADSSSLNTDGSGVVVEWFDNGTPAAAGKLAAGRKLHGTWQFFHKNGSLSALEVYDNGKLIKKEYFDEKGVKEADTTSKDRDAQFSGGGKAWQKYLQKQIYWPPNLSFQTSGEAVVVVRYSVDEDGKIVDAYVSLPFHPEFDRIALKAITQSPKWKPAISHNRKVKTYLTQPVGFVQNFD